MKASNAVHTLYFLSSLVSMKGHKQSLQPIFETSLKYRPVEILLFSPLAFSYGDIFYRTD